MADESHIQSLGAVNALERVIATILQRFEAQPDQFVRQADLVAGLALAALSEPALAETLTTADGHRTPLLHLGVPTFCAGSRGLPQTYDLALLQPSFARRHTLDVALNLDDQGAAALRDSAELQGAKPLSAIVSLRIVNGLTPADISGLIGDLGAMVRAERDAHHRYLVIFCRNWDLGAHIRRTLPLFEQWSELNPGLPFVVAQSHYDDIGGVFGARYFNIWSHMAPLSPL